MQGSSGAVLAARRPATGARSRALVSLQLPASQMPTKLGEKDRKQEHTAKERSPLIPASWLREGDTEILSARSPPASARVPLLLQGKHGAEEQRPRREPGGGSLLGVPSPVPWAGCKRPSHASAALLWSQKLVLEAEAVAWLPSGHVVVRTEQGTACEWSPPALPRSTGLQQNLLQSKGSTSVFSWLFCYRQKGGWLVLLAGNLRSSHCASSLSASHCMAGDVCLANVDPCSPPCVMLVGTSHQKGSSIPGLISSLQPSLPSNLSELRPCHPLPAQSQR